MIIVTVAVVCYSTATSRHDDRVVLVSLGVAEDPSPPQPPREISTAVRAIEIAMGPPPASAPVAVSQIPAREEHGVPRGVQKE